MAIHHQYQARRQDCFHRDTVMEVLNEGVKVGLLDHVMSLWRAMRLHAIMEGKKTQVKLDVLKFE